MAKVSKLVPIPRVPVPRVPALPGRRTGPAGSTKAALVSTAAALFAAQGYAATSLDAVVAGAEVTKGALYHHFSGKQALFEAAFEQVEADAARRIADALGDEQDPWARARAGLRAFLVVVEEPAYRRIVVQDGPAVLGYERFREHGERRTFGLVRGIVASVLGAAGFELDEAEVDTFARILFGAASSAGESVASAGDPAAEARRVEGAIGTIIAGFQALGQGV